MVWASEPASPVPLPESGMLEATEVKVAIAFDPSVVIAPMHTTTMSANMTAYSTAVGPSSLRSSRRHARRKVGSKGKLLFRIRSEGREDAAAHSGRRTPGESLQEHQ
jgi:hypothetical protein